MQVLAVAAALAFAAPAFAQDMPLPKMFQGLKGEKGQWRVDILESGGKAPTGRMPQMTICTDNLMRQSAPGAARPGPRADGCRHRLLKDTANEALMETTCPDRSSTVTLKREGKSILMSMQSTGGPRGPQTMKMRYTDLGPCRAGQGTVSLDKDSEQCRKLRERAAKMDPAKACARGEGDRDACEKRVRDAAAQLMAMCS